MRGPIDFMCSKEDSLLIEDIVGRAVGMARDAGMVYDKLDCSMDIRACHCNGCPLDLRKLLGAPDSDFGHDVFGIRRYIDRSTGRLTDCFLPRCAMPEVAA